MAYRFSLLVLWSVASVACARPGSVSGGMLLNVQPSPPPFVSGFDFELTDAIKGRACATRGAPDPSSKFDLYWFSGLGLENCKT